MIFLEPGDASSGLQHIVDNHGIDFPKIGISENQVSDVLMQTVAGSCWVSGSWFWSTHLRGLINGRPQRIAVTTGSKRYIVGANTAGVP